MLSNSGSTSDLRVPGAKQHVFSDIFSDVFSDIFSDVFSDIFPDIDFRRYIRGAVT